MIARWFNHTWTEARKMRKNPNRSCTDSHPALSSPRICQLVSRAILPLGERRSAIPERRSMNVEKGVRAKSRLASSNENLQTSATSLKWAQAFARPQGSVVTRCKFHTRAGSPVRGRHGRRLPFIAPYPLPSRGLVQSRSSQFMIPSPSESRSCM